MATGITVRQLFGVALLGCVVAAVFGAAPLAGWVDESAVAGSVVQQAADKWLALMQQAGLDRPYDVLRQAVREAEGEH